MAALPAPEPPEPLRHSLLRRQLRRHPGVLAHDDADVEAFLRSVEAAYRQADVERGMLERSLELSSDELLAANAELQRIVGEMRRAEETIRFQAYHDGLTGLANRILFHERLVEAIARARRHGRCLAVLFLDLDRFKRINDTLGHAAGDRLLAEVGRRLLVAKRTEDTMARVGGDEFVHLVSELDRPESAGRVAERLLQHFAPPFVLGERSYHVSASIGIALFPTDGEDADTLIRNADVALYRAKEGGRGGYRLYTPQMNDRVCHRLLLETDLRQAADRGELRLAYQPIVHADTGLWTGAEALLRWKRDGSVLFPDDFVPAAEEAGLIAGIGDWVLTTACAELAEWRARGPAPGRVAVNLSVHQLRPPLVPRVREILAACGLGPANLELEITETALLASPAEAAAVLHDLRDLGVAIALDDFGTGHSSFRHLKELPITTLKIDRAFVAGCPGDPRDTAIVGAILDLARGFGLRSIAEGVETEAQAELLRLSGCDELQGYLFARPADSEELDETFGGTGRVTVVRAPAG